MLRRVRGAPEAPGAMPLHKEGAPVEAPPLTKGEAAFLYCAAGGFSMVMRPSVIGV